MTSRTSPSRVRARVAVPELLAEAPDPGQEQDDDEDREEEPAGDARHVEAAPRSGRRPRASRSRGPSPGGRPRRSARPAGSCRRRAPRPPPPRRAPRSSAPRCRWSSARGAGRRSRWRGARSSSVSAAEKRSPRLRRTASSSASRSSARWTRPRTRAASAPTSAQRSGASACSVARAAGVRSGGVLGQDRLALLRGDRRVEGGVDRGERLGEHAELAARQVGGCLRPVVVLGRDGLARGLARGFRLDLAREDDGPRRHARRPGPGRRPRGRPRVGRSSIARIAVRPVTSRAAATTRRTASRRVKAATRSSRRESMAVPGRA